ncbi:MAG: anti-sigma factor [Moraxellaceae bacterium]
MKYDKPELQHRLAAEYVLGTLQGSARLRFERLLIGNDGLRRKVAAWEQRLNPWAAAVKAVPVPAHVWTGVQQRLGFSKAAPEKATGLWRWWAFASTALAAVLALVLMVQPAVVPPIAVPGVHDLAVLSTDKAEAVWIVRARNDGSALEFSSLSGVAVPTGHDLELWAIPAQGAPRSLGVVKLTAGRQATVAMTAELRQRMAGGVAMAISLEPTGGSATGAPTGPVLYSGKLQS